MREPHLQNFAVELCRKRSRELKEREKEQVANEPEADPERDQRTVFAYQVTAVFFFFMKL